MRLAVGGTSVAAPIMNGMEADTENFIAAQTYPGATPSIGFEGPIMYELGNSGNYADYYRDVLCGNDADPTGGPDGASALPGWDQASGWGAIDWLHYARATPRSSARPGLTTPSSLSQNYSWTCAKTPGNPTEHGISFPNSSIGYAVGPRRASPWFSTFLAERLVGRDEHVLQDDERRGDLGSRRTPTCSTSPARARATCVEVGDGGVINSTTNGGTTWTPETTPFTPGA